MSQFRALVPVKHFDQAKSRLGSVLSREQCALLAMNMLRDVLRALIAAEEVDGIVILSNEPALADIAEAASCVIVPETLPFGAALEAAAAGLASNGNRELLIMPADLPTLSGRDIRALHRAHRPGVTVCRASADGGTNALLLSPPDAIPFRFGPDSAARHVAAAKERGLPHQLLDLPAFAHDIDTPADLSWLLGQRIACATSAWLRASGIERQLGAGNAAAS